MDGPVVELASLRDGAVRRFEIGEPERLSAVLLRPDLCRLDDHTLVLFNRHHRALAVAVGPPLPPDHLVVGYAVSRLEGGAAVEIPGADGQPSWHTFVVREVRDDPDGFHEI
jgi:hypothetical protein